jgi:hypothetical protein
MQRETSCRFGKRLPQLDERRGRMSEENNAYELSETDNAD